MKNIYVDATEENVVEELKEASKDAKLGDIIWFNVADRAKEPKEELEL